MSDRNATADILIAEHELLNSSAEKVYDWFEKRSLDGGEKNRLDEEVELKLLNRNDELINLAVARYGAHNQSVRKVFNDAIKKKNEPVVLACLNNKDLGAGWLGTDGFPLSLFEQEADFEKWFKKISELEIITLFKNSALDDEFLTEYLTGEKYWNLLDETSQQLSIYALCYNNRFKREYDGPMDGYAEYSFNKVFRAAWSLADRVATTKIWGVRLGLFYTDIIDIRDTENLDATIQRWMIDDEDENKDRKKSTLNAYELIRSQLYKSKIGKYTKFSKAESSKLNDLAYRASAYQYMSLTIDEMEEAMEKDKLIAIDYMLKNEDIWRDVDKREALRKLCWDADGRFNDNYLDCANDFNYKKRELEKKYPNWFNEKSELDLDPDEYDLPVTVGRLKEMLDSLSTYEQSAWVLGEIRSIEQAHKNEIKSLKIMLIVVLAILFIKLVF